MYSPEITLHRLWAELVQQRLQHVCLRISAVLLTFSRPRMIVILARARPWRSKNVVSLTPVKGNKPFPVCLCYLATAVR